MSVALWRYKFKAFDGSKDYGKCDSGKESRILAVFRFLV